MFRLQEGKTTILVFGGSQGSRRINEAFLGAIQELKEDLDLQVIHISGKGNLKPLEEQYHKLGIPFALFEFLDKMEEAYLVADLVISRSGAVTVSEIASFRLPAIFIPYPHAQGHQKANASVLCDLKLARLIEDAELSQAALALAIREMISSAINVIVQTARMSDGSRRVIQIAEVLGMLDEMHINMQDLFRYRQTGVDRDGNVEGYFTPTGNIPSFYDEIRARGIQLSREVFVPKD